MDHKELKRMSRKELLELLLFEVEENEQLKQQLNELQNQLAERQYVIDNAGTLADASLQLSGIFEAAQNAANDYLDNLNLLTQRQTKLSNNMLIHAQKESERIIAEAEIEADSIRYEAETYAEMVRQKVDALWKEAAEPSNEAQPKDFLPNFLYLSGEDEPK